VQQRTALIDGLFRQHILPREEQLTGTCSDLTERLIDVYADDVLGSAEQALLNLWISENLRSLASHPFAPEAQRDTLNRRWQQLQAEESGLDAPAARSGNLFDELFDDDLDEDDEIFDFGWHTDRNGQPDTVADHEAAANATTAPSPDAHEDATAGTRTGGDTLGEDRLNADPDARIEQLEKRLSVDHLFRQLARTLHPDLEQDEARKAQKHELMSECLRARKNKDINTLLTLYCEHVGDLPEEFSGHEHEELIQALEQQLRQLQTELRQLRFGNGLQAQIVERYSDADDEATRGRVLRHADSLDQEISILRERLVQIGTTEGLHAELAQRREIEQNRMAIDSLTGYSSGR